MGCFSNIPANATHMESDSSGGRRVATTGTVSIWCCFRLCNDVNSGRTDNYKFGSGLAWWKRGNWDSPLTGTRLG